MSAVINSALALSTRMLRWFILRLRPDARPWGEAIVAELNFVPGRLAALGWAGGGILMMTRLLLKQWCGALRRPLTPGEELQAATRPPRRWPPIVFVLLALALLLSPELRKFGLF